MDEYLQLLERIVKGSEFIASIHEDHPQWRDANELYDQLCCEAIEMRGMIDCPLNEKC